MPAVLPAMGSSMSGLVARLRRHFSSRTRGQSFVEFALVLPLFLLFLAATLDLGRVFYANITHFVSPVNAAVFIVDPNGGNPTLDTGVRKLALID
jgi:hypothetical protein